MRLYRVYLLVWICNHSVHFWILIKLQHTNTHRAIFQSPDGTVGVFFPRKRVLPKRGHVDAARKLLLRGLRCLPKSVRKTQHWTWHSWFTSIYEVVKLIIEICCQLVLLKIDLSKLSRWWQRVLYFLLNLLLFFMLNYYWNMGCWELCQSHGFDLQKHELIQRGHDFWRRPL